MAKQRADALLVERGLAESRNLAQRLVMAGQVRANGQVVAKPSSMLDTEVTLEVDRGPRYVSRGGEKLEAALQAFAIPIDGKVCADVGSSTGGFTDCLLQHGAAKVYAIDVGKGQLHWKLRQDTRVVVMEETNARSVQLLPEFVSLIVVDASFISLKTLLPVIVRWLQPNADLVLLVKPQFEAGKQEAGRGKGVIRDAGIHQRVLAEVLTFAQGLGLSIRGLLRSPVVGPKGNIEFLLWVQNEGASIAPADDLIQRLFTAEESVDGSDLAD